jgi:hypothetical protein
VSAAAPDLKAIIDFPSGRAAVGFVGDDPASAAMVFVGNTVFQRRLSLPAGPQAAAAAGAPTNLLPLAASAKLAAAPPVGVPPTVAPTTTTTTPAAGASRLHRSTKIQRNWLSFDYASIPKRNTDKTAGSFVINPVAIERLLDGTLTGSVRQVEPGHYKLNVNRDKAERHLSVKQKKDLDKTFRANAIHGRVFPADVWLDATGNLTRMTVRFRQTLTNIDRDDLYVTLDLAPSAAPGAIALPDPKETAVVQNLGQLVRGALGS